MNRAEFRTAATRLFLRAARALAVLVVLLILLGGYLLVIGQKVSEVRTVGLQSLSDERARLTERERYHADLVAMAERYQRDVSTDDRQFVHRTIPDGAQVPELLTALEAIATASGGLPTDISVTEPTGPAAAPTSGSTIDELIRGKRPVTAPSLGVATPSATVQALTVRLVLSAPGGYPTLKTFLDALETSERLLNVTAIRFSLAREGAGPNQGEREGTYEVLLTTAFLPTPATAP